MFNPIPPTTPAMVLIFAPDVGLTPVSGNTPSEIVDALKGQWFRDKTQSQYMEDFARRCKVGYGDRIPPIRTGDPQTFVTDLITARILIPIKAYKHIGGKLETIQISPEVCTAESLADWWTRLESQGWQYTP